MKENAIKTKSFAFSIKIVNLYKAIIAEKKEFVLSRQLLRSGTSIGAMVREAEQAESKADFIHKLAIGLKEANETDYISVLEYNEIKNDIGEILKLLTSIIKTSKSK